MADTEPPPLARALAAESVGTAFLLAAVVGSGIMGERLAGGNMGVALLANSLATGAALAAIVLALAPVSGAHLNPAVTVVLAAWGRCPWRRVPAYAAAQVVGALAGVALAHFMFDLEIVQASSHVRRGFGQWAAECTATFGLLLVIAGCHRHPVGALAAAVGGYIAAAYWFTASTSFANPAVTLARAFTDTFAGIAPGDAPAFVVAQSVGAVLAAATLRWLVGLKTPERAAPNE
jgi:glycerol uptake facilitator-like aquaporin